MKKEIAQNNKVIAEFMGYEFYELDVDSNKDYFTASKKGEPFRRGHITDLKYSSDWNWLMCVFQKCISLKHPVTNNDTGWMKSERLYIPMNYFRNIEYVFDEVYNWVNWYNSKKINSNKKID